MGESVIENDSTFLREFRFALFDSNKKDNKPTILISSLFISLKKPISLSMADLEAVLADVSYLMAMEKSKSTPAASASKKIVLPDRTYVN